MLENLKAIYSHYRWAKLVVCLMLAGAGYLLFQVAGGFPPWAWRFLFNVLPRLTSLWATQGSGVLLPLIGLLLLSFSLLVLWTVIVLGISQSIVLFWQNADEEEHSQPDLDEYTLLMKQHALQPSQSQSAYKMQFALTQPDRYDDDEINAWESMGVGVRTPNSQDNLDDFAWAGASSEPMDTIPTQPAQVQVRSKARPEQANQAHEPETYSRRSHPRIPPVPTSDIPAPTRTTPTERRMSSRTRSRPHIPPIPSISNPSEQEQRWSEVDAVSSQTVQAVQSTQTAEQRQRRQQTQQTFEEQESQQTVQSHQFQQPSSQQIQPLRGAVPTYDPVPQNTWSSTRPARTPHGHLRLVPEEIEPELLFSVDGKESLEEQNGEELEQTQTLQDTQPTRPTRSTRPIVIDEEQTRPVRTAWNEEEDEQEATLRLVVGIGLDPGLVRKDRPNEDSLFAIQGIRTTHDGSVPAGLFVIADGMGGHANGREASRLAVRSISDIIVPALLRDDSNDSLDEQDEQELLLDLLKDGVQRANLAIYQRNHDLTDMMGTTITTALIVNTTAYIVNVGDSRTYLYRAAEGLVPITRDHSVVARLVETGHIKRDEIYTHPQRNQIYRCLGEHTKVEMDTFVVPLQPDDILLLCSDGLWEMVRDSTMEKIIASSSHLPAQISNILVQTALNQGGADNISVVVVGIVKTTL